MGKKLWAYQKLESMAMRYFDEQGPTIPRDVLEANISREFRLCKQEIRKMLEELKIYEKIKRKNKKLRPLNPFRSKPIR